MTLSAPACRDGRPIEVGLVLATGQVPVGGHIAHWHDVLDIATRAEAAGFDSLWVSDGLLVCRNADTEAVAPWEAWSLLSALAAATRQVEIGTLSLAVSERNPALLAKMAMTVDEISGGRLELGLGAGWSASDLDAFGFPTDHRADRFDEAIQILAGLLCGQRMTFEGAYCRAHACEVSPHSPTLGGPPITITGPGPRLARLAALYADAWDSGFIDAPMDVCNARARMEIIDAACEAVGRDPGSLERAASIMVDLPGHPHRHDHWAARWRASRHPAHGTPDELAGLLLAYANEGFSRVQVWLDPCTPEAVEQLAESLEMLEPRSLDVALTVP